MANLSADELRSKFTAFAEAAGVEKLGKPAFISLVQALISQEKSLPLKEADLEMAFTLADEDKSGSVDVFEFIKLFRLIREGKVEGLGKKSFMRRKSKLAVQVKSALCDDGKPFEAGAFVKWMDADEDIPSGTVGKVLYCHDDGDVEVLFRSAVSSTEAVYTFRAEYLIKVEPSQKEDEQKMGEDSRKPRSNTPENAMNLSADELRGRFAMACKAEGAEDLSKASFKALVMSLLTNGGQPSTRKGLPSERDLDAAFVLADEDKSGRVDVYEFIKLCFLVQNGKITGLGRRKSVFGGSDIGANDSSVEKKHAAAIAAIKGEGQPFALGSSVCWRGADEDIPRGTVGKVLCCHDDGDVEVLFRSPATGTESVYTFGADRLYAEGSLSAAEVEAMAKASNTVEASTSTPTKVIPAHERSWLEAEAKERERAAREAAAEKARLDGNVDAAAGSNPLISGVPNKPRGLSPSSQPPCHQCGEPWAAQSGFLLGDGKHSRCCRVCSIVYCHRCKYIYMTKAPVAAAAPKAKGSSPATKKSNSAVKLPTPQSGEFIPSRGADAWTCRPCAAATGVTWDSKACVECKAPWVEKDSFLGSGQHSRACVTCGKAYCYKCKDKHMVKEGAVDGWYKGLTGRGEEDATSNDGLVLSKPVRRRECLDCRSGKFQPLHSAN